MSKDEIKNRVIPIIELVVEETNYYKDRDKINITEIDSFNKLELNELDNIDIIIRCEKEFNISIPDEDINDMNKWLISDLIEYLSNNYLKHI